MTDLTDRKHMARALQLAELGLYSTMPNPRVGCVLVRDGRVVGEGWHRRAGEGHAEVNALAAAGDAARGATAYVTLEPCSHTGKTGPCCEALVQAGVSRVVYAMEDPNPQVAGRGLAHLLQAGIEVDGPLLEEQAWGLNPGFIRRMESGRPFVRCKMAMSLDGRTAMASGESKWITGPRARADVQKLRARSCAIITGIDSIDLDDASLNVRAEELKLADAALAASVQPLRVVLDSKQRLRPPAKVLQSPPLTLVVSAMAEPNTALTGLDGVEQLSLPDRDGRIGLRALLAELAARQCNEVLVEAGATLAGAFLRQGLLDELVIYVAPKLLGSSARPLFELPLDTMAKQLPVSIRDMRAVGSDWRITAVPDPDA
ncbi:bifunctional diaminohydroxyphosphoribosylaminopyrimidine deaminase/5-amino-6-(5-phosphoribosylamino)uracil reductase RibD [Pseudomaricurvus sp. HS19]|uniref:bifunctional diaminohydroxyphosphoribosylaminopyrimidine deaminase/5-amino-6-(5-phosphoribosylamino)uracil reductase RibD n=1 Tax=Pseudomaricurvus sp. HS19 TaxID=2692626 RepID=UPI001369F698|nr:bifunctional diaminohydroxyphosphoribosylaminopyrimidine deaminase/5-amino-6-(5-phosphoribosylamino)uracil reductase RibD [Pseudomaricurvus sp. HS19]MYM64310.1 bifunctional diaminohydroxyphosphoribosylaminopyrimidine deaminase/5-amino-6-(5-phosphoribosylamino)uracil reductase RibD [Pseudomaricurvus sp. HS19]